MTEDEMIKRDIDTLRESIKLDNLDLSLSQRTSAEKAGIREHITHCQAALAELAERLGGKN